MHKDVRAVAELDRADEDQPLQGIEDLVRWIGGQRLPSGQVAVPQRQLAAGDRIVHDPLERHVVRVEVAVVEIAAPEEHIGEEQRADGQEAENAEDAGPALWRHQEPDRLKTIGMMTKSWTASKIPCAMIPGMRCLGR